MTRKMKDSGIEWIGEIPEEWEVVKLKYISEFYNGFSFDSNDLISDYTYPVIRIGDIDKEIVDLNSKLGIKENLGLSPYLIKDKDILLAMSGATVGKVGFVEKSGESYINQRVGIIRSSNPYFVFYNLLTNNFLEYINIRADGSAQPNISTKMIENFSIAYPKDGKTQKITNEIKRKINSINNTINVIYNQLENLENYKKSLITEAVTKGLDKNVEMKDSGIEWIGEIPKSWKVTKVKYIGKLQNGISKNAKYFGKGYPFISYGDVYKNNSLPDEVNGLVESTFSEQALYSVKKGDVFFTRTSETLEEIGYSSVSLKNFEKATFAGFLIRLRPYKSSAILPNYSKYYFRSEHLREYLAKEMTIVTRASLGQQLLNDMVVLLPNIEEQKIIINYLDKKCKLIDDLIAIKKKQLEILEEYKKSLIYEYVTGKKEVKDGEET